MGTPPFRRSGVSTERISPRSADLHEYETRLGDTNTRPTIDLDNIQCSTNPAGNPPHQAQSTDKNTGAQRNIRHLPRVHVELSPGTARHELLGITNGGWLATGAREEGAPVASCTGRECRHTHEQIAREKGTLPDDPHRLPRVPDSHVVRRTKDRNSRELKISRDPDILQCPQSVPHQKPLYA